MSPLTATHWSIFLELALYRQCPSILSVPHTYLVMVAQVIPIQHEWTESTPLNRFCFILTILTIPCLYLNLSIRYATPKVGYIYLWPSHGGFHHEAYLAHRHPRLRQSLALFVTHYEQIIAHLGQCQLSLRGQRLVQRIR